MEDNRRLKTPHAKMLVLSRKVGEKILIGDSISVTVVRISGGGVRIGIEAPADLPVVREELSLEQDSRSDSNGEPVMQPHSPSISSPAANRPHTERSSTNGTRPKKPK